MNTPLRSGLSSSLHSSLHSQPVFDFLPSDVAGLKLWTRFNSGITVTGSGVAQWDDVSGNGNHLKQATDTNRPVPGSLGAEEVTNGDFTTDTDWTKGTGWTIAAGVASCDGSQTSSSLLAQASVTSDSIVYLMTFTISGYSAGSLVCSIGGDTGTSRAANGTYSEILTRAGGGDNLNIVADTNFVGNVDNVSVKAIDNSQGILFDGVDNFLKADAFTLIQPETVYILGKQVTWVSGERIFDGNAVNTGALRQLGTTPDLSCYAGADGATTSDLILDTYSSIAVVFDHDNSLNTLQIDNNTPSTDTVFGTADMGGFTLGAHGGNTNFSNIQIKECLIYNTAHDLAQRTQIINYLLSL